MREMNMSFLDGSKHLVSVMSAANVINLKTGRKEIILKYVDHTLGDVEMETSVINVMGVWMIYPEYKGRGETLVVEDLGEDFIESLPENIRTFDAADRLYAHDTVNYYYAGEISSYIKEKLESVGMFQDEDMQTLFRELIAGIVDAYGVLFNTIGRCEWEIPYIIESRFKERFDESLGDAEETKLALKKLIEVCRNISGNFSITARYQAIGNIYRKLGAIYVANSSFSFAVIIMLLSSIDVFELTSEQYIKFIGDLLAIIAFAEISPTDKYISTLEQCITGLVQEYSHPQKEEKQKLELTHK